jgi:oxygen-dependent protoporphyrinogen oxidase
MHYHEGKGMSFRGNYEPSRRVIVVGAGIAGLACAYYLNKYGYDVRIFEREDSVGGMIQTSWRENKYLIECGPNTYLSSSDHITSLTRELSLDRLEMRNKSKERFIYWDGALRLVPNGPLSLLKTKLLSPVGKARLLAEPLIRSQSFEGETLASFVRRRGGVEVLETLVDPFVSGVWAGDPGELELRAVMPKIFELEQKHGSIIRGISKEKTSFKKHDMLSYRWGMGTLPARLEEVLRRKLKLNTGVKEIIRDEDGRLFACIAEKDRRLEADAVIVATSPYAAAHLIDKQSPRTAVELMNIEFCPITVVHTAFKKKDVGFKVRGFGFLVPRVANVRILGTLFSSALFDHRAPKDEVLLTTFIGGATDPDAIGLSDDDIMREVRKGLHITLGINTKPEFTKITRLKHAIPQYKVGHTHRLKRIDKEMERLPGLYLTGNYFSGISVSDTIGHAKQTAETARAFLSKPKIRKL